MPTKTYISYETKVWLPYFIKRYILFRRDTPKPPPVIDIDKRAGSEDYES